MKDQEWYQVQWKQGRILTQGRHLASVKAASHLPGGLDFLICVSVIELL